jgi:adenylate kinase family enzyme
MRNPFLNVDLEIEASSPIALITAEFGEEVSVLYSGETAAGFLAAYEASFLNRDADTIVERFCRLIKSLSEDARREWDGCYRRTFDIGYSPSGLTEMYVSRIRAETVNRVSKLNAEIAGTIYPPSDEAEPVRDGNAGKPPGVERTQ